MSPTRVHTTSKLIIRSVNSFPADLSYWKNIANVWLRRCGLSPAVIDYNHSSPHLLLTCQLDFISGVIVLFSKFPMDQKPITTVQSLTVLQLLFQTLHYRSEYVRNHAGFLLNNHLLISFFLKQLAMSTHPKNETWRAKQQKAFVLWISHIISLLVLTHSQSEWCQWQTHPHNDSFGHTASMDTYRTSVWDGLDVGVIVVGHLLIVGTQEAQRLVVAVTGGVVPRHRLVAAVGEVLPGWGCQ